MLGDQLEHSLAAIADHDRYVSQFLEERAARKAVANLSGERHHHMLSFVPGTLLFRRSKSVS